MPSSTIGLRAKESFTGSTTITKTFIGEMNAFVLINDGTADITITINDDDFIVKPNEIFDENFEPFKTVTITNAGGSAFRAYGRC